MSISSLELTINALKKTIKQQEEYAESLEKMLKTDFHNPMLIKTQLITTTEVINGFKILLANLYDAREKAP